MPRNTVTTSDGQEIINLLELIRLLLISLQCDIKDMVGFPDSVDNASAIVSGLILESKMM